MVATSGARNVDDDFFLIRRPDRRLPVYTGQECDRCHGQHENQKENPKAFHELTSPRQDGDEFAEVRKLPFEGGAGMFKVLGLVLVMLAVFGAPVMGNFTTSTEDGFHFQSIYVEYDPINKTNIWGVELGQNITKWLFYGVTLRTQVMGYNLKDEWFPAGIPTAQYYGILVGITIGNFTFTINDWCNHYLSQAGLLAYRKDTEGLTYRLEYQF